MKPLSLSPIFCINLDKYPERWKRTQTEFKRAFNNASLMPKLHRYPAVDRTDEAEPGRGCGESFCQLVSKAKTNKWPYIIICEDDVRFVKGAYEKIQRAMECRPQDADILLFGSYCLRFSKASVVNEHWLSLHGTYASHHFVVFFASMYDKILRFKEHVNYRHLDRFIGNRFVATGKIKGYVMWPMVAKQYDGYSTTMKKNVSYNSLLWTRRHHLLWYNQEYHEHAKGSELIPICFNENDFDVYKDLMRDFFVFLKQKGSLVLEYSDEEFTQLVLFWYGMQSVYDKIMRRIHGIDVHEFERFRSQITSYYATVQKGCFPIDTAHLILAYTNPTIFDEVVANKYGLSFTEFKYAKQKQQEKTKQI